MTQTRGKEQSRQQSEVLLFTAFEPSGDAHAAPVIRALREMAPSLRICAWGGKRMAEAGATMVEYSADDGTMGLNALVKMRAVSKHIKAIKRWMKQYRVVGHVPVDSPAANFPICAKAKSVGAKVIHLVAPQLWAWGTWRTRKLRRLTDMVLCLLPFEEQWFRERNIPASFIGHPAMNCELDEKALAARARELPRGELKLALFPGSRSQEVRANLRLLLNTFAALHDRHPRMCAIIVASNDDVAGTIRSRIGAFPQGLHMLVGERDSAIAWCDLAVTVSGTNSLHIARQRKPMVGVYRTGIVSWLGSKVLLRTPYRLLPNVIANREICPEFIPHVGGVGPIVAALNPMIDDSKKAVVQSESLRRVCLRFANKRPGEEGARRIIETLGLKKTATDAAPDTAQAHTAHSHADP